MAIIVIVPVTNNFKVMFGLSYVPKPIAQVNTHTMPVIQSDLGRFHKKKNKNY